MVYKFFFLFLSVTFTVAYEDISNCPESERFLCKEEPCFFAKCPLHPYATCKNNYCGGCQAEWYYRSKLVDCFTLSSCQIAQVIRCGKRPCDGVECPMYPDAICIDNYCGPCTADFYLNSVKVDCENGGPARENSTCDDTLKVKCLVDPCKTSVCLKYPHAKCKMNTCSGCFTTWYKSKYDDTQVNCDYGKCKSVSCLVNPCKAKCALYPNAICIANYCGECSAYWYIKKKGKFEKVFCF